MIAETLGFCDESRPKRINQRRLLLAYGFVENM